MIIKELKYIKNLFILKNKPERYLFFSYFFVFFIIGFGVFLFNYPSAGLTHFSGYDPNSFISAFSQPIQTAQATIRHPLFRVFMLPLSLVINAATVFINSEVVVFLIYLFFNVVGCYSVIFLFRILNEIINLNIFRSVLLCVFFSSFAHVLAQFFTPESYPISLLLLLICIYIIGEELKTEEQQSPLLHSILFFLTAGTTITNGLKFLILYWFRKSTLVHKLKWILVTGALFLFTSGVVYLGTKVLEKRRPLNTSITTINETKTQQKKTVTEITKTSPGFLKFINFKIKLWPSVIENMLGESVLYHDANFKSDISRGRDIYLSYSNKTNYIFIAILYSLLVFVLLLSIKEELIFMLISMFSVDLFIHVICRFGLDEAYIFSAHWIFIIPIILSHIYIKINSKRIHIIADVTFIILTLYTLQNNLTMISDFIFNTPL